MSAEPTRAPGFWFGAWLVAWKDLKVELRTLEGVAAMTLFSLSVFLVFGFAFDLATVRTVGPAELVPGVLWTAFVFSAIIGSTRTMQLERQQDSTTALLLAPVDRGTLFAGKALATFLALTALEAILLPLSAALFDYDLLRAAPSLALVVALHTVGIAELGILLGAVTTRVRRGESLLSILLLPASTPLFLSAVRSTEAAIRGEGLSGATTWLLVAAGFDALYFFVSLLTFEFVLED